MKMAPRLLPLVGVAVAGVVGLKIAGGIDGVSSLIDARAHAEEAAPAKAGKRQPGTSGSPAASADPATPVRQPGALPGLPTQAQANAPAAGPAVCAPSAAELAKEAGLSPAELQVIQTLGARRGQLDAREQALDTQLQLIAAAEQKLNGRMQAMNALKGEIQSLVGQADAQQQAEIDRLVTVYEKMKPKDAGPLMAALDDKVRIPVAAKMKPAALAAILAQMGTAQAKALSESLAKRFTPAQTLQQALDGKPVPAPDAKASPPAPIQTASAAPIAATPTSDARPAAPKPVPAKARQARAAPRRKPPVARAEPAAPKVESAAVAASGATARPTTTAAAAAPPPTPAAKAPPRPTAGPPA